MLQTSPKPFCFVLMPFDEAFRDVYQLGIKEACSNAGAYCERVDEQIFDERILDRIYNQIAKADIVIADMTGRNPNVFYEVGYAHALNKLTILLTKDASDIPFDLKHFPHIVYANSISSLRDELQKRVAHFIAHPPTKRSDMKLGLQLFINDQDVAVGMAIAETISRPRRSSVPIVILTVKNISTDTFEAGDFKVGIETSPRFTSTRLTFELDHANSIKLPNQRYLHMIDTFGTLLPATYASVKVPLDSENTNYLPPGQAEEAILHLFTRQGSHNYPFIIAHRWVEE